jgi:hypothetical protein
MRNPGLTNTLTFPKNSVHSQKKRAPKMIFLLETFWGYMLDLRLCNPLPSTMHPAPGETMRRVYDCGALPRPDISLCQKKNGKICPIWQSDEEFSPKLTVYDSSGDLI